MAYDYDYAVIGSGPGGLTISIGLAILGKNVCLIEKDHIGGDCTNFGCVPSKALLDAARQQQFSGTAEALDYVRTKRQEIRNEETPSHIEAYGVTLITGHASFVDPHTLEVDEQQITAKRMIIATGATARQITIPGIDQHDLLTNETLYELSEDINYLVIVGGGVISCEMAEAFSNLGVTVTIVEKHQQILGQFDTTISETMHDYLTSLGVRIITQATPLSGNNKTLSLITPDGQVDLPYDKILVAIGREANISSLGLEHTQIQYDNKGIHTNQYNQTTHQHIYALGDCVAGNPQFTHRANHEARILLQNLTVRTHGRPRHWRNPRKRFSLPRTIYTGLEVAHVGLFADQAVTKYGNDGVIVRTISLANNDRSKLTNRTTGYMQIVAKRFSLKILGVTIVGEHAGEMLPQYTLAIQHNISLWQLRNTIYAYPTVSEIVKTLIDTYFQELLANPFKESIDMVKYFLRFKQ